MRTAYFSSHHDVSTRGVSIPFNRDLSPLSQRPLPLSHRPPPPDRDPLGPWQRPPLLTESPLPLTSPSPWQRPPSYREKPPFPPPPVNRMTHACKNIALPQTSFAGGKYSTGAHEEIYPSCTPPCHVLKRNLLRHWFSTLKSKPICQ